MKAFAIKSPRFFQLSAAEEAAILCYFEQFVANYPAPKPSPRHAVPQPH